MNSRPHTAGMLTPITAGRVAPILRMLGSPIDGEILAAACALRRVLAADGLDLHALADALEEAAKPRERASPPQRAPRSRKQWADLLGWLNEQRSQMTERDAEFIASVKRLFGEGHDLSKLQKKWIRDVERKLMRSAA